MENGTTTFNKQLFLEMFTYIEECVDASDPKAYMFGIKEVTEKGLNVLMSTNGDEFERFYSWDDLEKGPEHFQEIVKKIEEEKKKAASEKARKQIEKDRNERYKQFLELKKEFKI